jgi:hypothetical protein
MIAPFIAHKRGVPAATLEAAPAAMLEATPALVRATKAPEAAVLYSCQGDNSAKCRKVRPYLLAPLKPSLEINRKKRICIGQAGFRLPAYALLDMVK